MNYWRDVSVHMFGTLLAAAVIYLIGVISGGISLHTWLLVPAIFGAVVALWLALGQVLGARANRDYHEWLKERDQRGERGRGGGVQKEH